MVKKTINELSQDLQTYDTRLDALETNTRKEQIEAIARDVFKQQLGHESFQNKVKALFSDHMTRENFINKVVSIAKKEIASERQNMIVKAVLYVIGGFVLAIIGGIAQSVFHFIP